jgi:hypothetical protein
MQLRHISPKSTDWVDAMEGGGGRGWEKLAPEERTKLRLGEYATAWAKVGEQAEGAAQGEQGDQGNREDNDSDYGWEAVSASK